MVVRVRHFRKSWFIRVPYFFPPDVPQPAPRTTTGLQSTKTVTPTNNRGVWGDRDEGLVPHRNRTRPYGHQDSVLHLRQEHPRRQDPRTRSPLKRRHVHTLLVPHPTPRRGQTPVGRRTVVERKMFYVCPILILYYPRSVPFVFVKIGVCINNVKSKLNRSQAQPARQKVNKKKKEEILWKI